MFNFFNTPYHGVGNPMLQNPQRQPSPMPVNPQMQHGNQFLQQPNWMDRNLQPGMTQPIMRPQQTNWMDRNNQINPFQQPYQQPFQHGMQQPIQSIFSSNPFFRMF